MKKIFIILKSFKNIFVTKILNFKNKKIGLNNKYFKIK